MSSSLPVCIGLSELLLSPRHRAPRDRGGTTSSCTASCSPSARRSSSTGRPRTPVATPAARASTSTTHPTDAEPSPAVEPATAADAAAVAGLDAAAAALANAEPATELATRPDAAAVAPADAGLAELPPPPRTHSMPRPDAPALRAGRVAEPPSSRAAAPPSRRAAEPSSCHARHPPSSRRAAEPPNASSAKRYRPGHAIRQSPPAPAATIERRSVPPSRRAAESAPSRRACRNQ